MPVDLSDTLVVAISSTALFDMSESAAVFDKALKKNPDEAVGTYRAYMLKNEEVPLEPGTGQPLVRALLRLNQYQKEGEAPLVEVVVLSRNSPETGVRVLRMIRELGLEISRSAFTGGGVVADYLEAFDVDLFLTTNGSDAQSVIDSRQCAAAILRAPPGQFEEEDEEQVRFAFDGDAVLFDESSELVYKKRGLKAFHDNEDVKQDVELPEGPYAGLLRKLARLQDRLPMRVEDSPVRIALVTARNSPAEMRAIKTLRKWGVYVDAAFFLGGVEKTKVLKAFQPHIFFDDQNVHLDSAAGIVPSGQVPYASDSPLRNTKDGEDVGDISDQALPDCEGAN